MERLKFRSGHVPLRMQAYGNPTAFSTAWDGGCALLPVVAEVVQDVTDECTMKCTPSNGWTAVFALTFDGLLGSDPSNTKVIMFYDPGKPSVTAELICPPDPPIPLPISDFATLYAVCHADERIDELLLRERLLREGLGAPAFWHGAEPKWRVLCQEEVRAVGQKRRDRDRGDLDVPQTHAEQAAA